MPPQQLKHPVHTRLPYCLHAWGARICSKPLRPVFSMTTSQCANWRLSSSSKLPLLVCFVAVQGPLSHLFFLCAFATCLLLCILGLLPFYATFKRLPSNLQQIQMKACAPSGEERANKGRRVYLGKEATAAPGIADLSVQCTCSRGNCKRCMRCDGVLRSRRSGTDRHPLSGGPHQVEVPLQQVHAAATHTDRAKTKAHAHAAPTQLTAHHSAARRLSLPQRLERMPAARAKNRPAPAQRLRRQLLNIAAAGSARALRLGLQLLSAICYCWKRAPAARRCRRWASCPRRPQLKDFNNEYYTSIKSIPIVPCMNECSK